MTDSYQIKPIPSQKLMTPSNVITLVRICLVPFFVAALLSPWPSWFALPPILDEAKSLIAAVIFILISCTDWLDGYLARHRNEVTDFGKFMDPLADKILVCAALLALIELGSLPSWVVLIILTREFIVAGVRMMAAREGVVIAASWYGKAKTVTQMIAIVLFVIKDNHMVSSIHEAFSDWLWVLSWIVMCIALVLTIVSMLDYIAKARHLIGFAPRSKKGSRFSRDMRNYACQKVPAEENEDGIGVKGDTKDGDDTEDDAEVCLQALIPLAESVLCAARKQGKTIGTAESLTGGLIAAMLTEVPGSSEVIKGGIISYATEVKRDVLGVPPRVLEGEGVVSEATVCLMAQGARQKLNCDITVAVSGIAGPAGGGPDNPVGSVWIGCAGPLKTKACFKHFSGSREQVRLKTVRFALKLVRKMLEKQ